VLRVVALLVAIGSLPCLAGEGFLDRSKVHEAVPYGTTVESPPAGRTTVPSTLPDHEAGRPSNPTPGGSAPATTRDDRDRDPDER
jgi:hypothetical protein